MLKNLARLASRSVGFDVVSLERLGVEMELDLARLTQDAPLRIIFDVGANFGQSALQFAKAFPESRILSFEPVPESFARLQGAVKAEPRIQTYHHALGDVPGTATIHIAPHAGANSIKSAASSVDSVEVEIDTLDLFCGRHGIHAIDLLKIDVEGFEMEVLRGAEQLLRRGAVRFIYAECVISALPPNTSHTSFFDLWNHLSSHGFCAVSCYSESFYLDTGTVLMNVLFARLDALPKSVKSTVQNIASSANPLP